MAGRRGKVSAHTKRLHAERLEERRLAALRDEVEQAERRYNGSGEAQVVLGVQLAKILQEWRIKFDAQHDYEMEWSKNEKVMGAIEWLKEMTGLHVRRCYGLMHCEFETVPLTQAELVLMAIDREYLLSNGTVHIIPNPNWSLERWINYMEERGCI